MRLYFIFSRVGPSVRFGDTVDVVGTRDLNIGLGLMEVDAIVIGGEAKVLERDNRFVGEFELGTNDIEDGGGNSLILAGDEEIINLSKEHNFVSLKGCLIDAFIMCG